MATRRETSCGSNDFTSEAGKTFSVRVTEEKNPLLERQGFAEGHRAIIEPGYRDVARMHGLPQKAVYFCFESIELKGFCGKCATRRCDYASDTHSCSLLNKGIR